MEFEEIDPLVWKPSEEGDSIEGILIRKDTDVGPNKSNTYHIELDGKQTMIWGSAVLDDRMSFVDPGDYVRITFKKIVENSKGQDTKIFKVERGKDRGEE